MSFWRPDALDLRLRRRLTMIQDAPGAGHLEIAWAPAQEPDPDTPATLDAVLGGDWGQAVWSWEPVDWVPEGAPEPGAVDDFRQHLFQQLQSHDIEGADVVTTVPRGWCFIGQVLVTKLIAWKTERPSTEYRIDDIIQRDLGPRFYLSSGDARVQNLERWAEAQAAARDPETGVRYAGS